MENQLIDLKLKITELERENIALKTKITLMYNNWKFDYSRFMEVKALLYAKNNDKIEDET